MFAYNFFLCCHDEKRLKIIKKRFNKFKCNYVTHNILYIYILFYYKYIYIYVYIYIYITKNIKRKFGPFMFCKNLEKSIGNLNGLQIEKSDIMNGKVICILFYTLRIQMFDVSTI